MRTDGNNCGGSRVVDPDPLVGSVFSNGSDPGLKVITPCLYMVLIYSMVTQNMLRSVNIREFY